MNVRLISLTRPVDPTMTPEELIVYEARVSNPQNQTNNATAAKLLKYCWDHKHVSIFDQVDMTVEIKTSRMISAQLLRHWSFDFQEFSQRYSEVTEFELYEARASDVKNRQNSIDNLDSDTKQWFRRAQEETWAASLEAYQIALSRGIAKECARALLPMSISTTLYMKGSVRNWIFYLQTRTGPETQKEHRDVAEAIKIIFKEQFPIISEAVFNEQV